MGKNFTIKFRRLEAYFEAQPTVSSKVRDSASDVGINMNPNTKSSEEGPTVLEGRISKYGLEAKYEWEISDRNTDSIPIDKDVTETVYLRSGYRFNFAFFCVLMATVPLTYQTMLGPNIPIWLLFTPAIGISCLVIGTYILLPNFILPHGLNEDDSSIHILSEKAPTTRLSLGLAVILFIGILSPGAVQPALTYMSSSALIVLGVVAIADFDRLVNW